MLLMTVTHSQLIFWSKVSWHLSSASKVFFFQINPYNSLCEGEVTLYFTDEESEKHTHSPAPRGMAGTAFRSCGLAFTPLV